MVFFAKFGKLIIKFLGTKGYIEKNYSNHKNYSGVLFEAENKKLLVDCGEAKFLESEPDQIILSHTHPDHFGAFLTGKAKFTKPFYCSSSAYGKVRKYNITDLNVFEMEDEFNLNKIFKIKVFPIEHSYIARNVGIIVSALKRKVCYCSDILFFPKYKEKLRGVDLYIGDLSFLYKPMVRKKEMDEVTILFGHIDPRTQLTWLKKSGVKKAIFTHLGEKALAMDERKLKKIIRDWGEERGIDAEVAHDNQKILL